MGEVVRALIMADHAEGEQVREEIGKLGLDASHSCIISGINDLEERLSEGRWDIAVLDYSLKTARSVKISSFFSRQDKQIPVLVWVRDLTLDSARGILESGASDVVTFDDLQVAILKAMFNRRRIDHRIHEQAELLDHTSDAIYVCDQRGIITYWNRGAEKLYEYTPHQAIGAHADTLCPPDDRKAFSEARDIAWRDGEWIGQLAQTAREGKSFTAVTRCTTILDEQGRPKSLLVVSTDISEMKALEEQFIRSQRLESIGTLAGGIAHDLNNVLAPIIMASFLLRAKIDRPDIQKLVDTVENSALRGSDIVKQVLTFAKGVEGEHNIVQPKHILRDIAKIIKETFPRNIRIDVEIPRDLPTIQGDATQFQQMILNICLNARDAVESKGDSIRMEAEVVELDESFVRMHVDCKRPGTYILVEIEDNGCGIASGDLDHVFDPFFTTRKINQGTGLGLSTALAIAKGHSGFINIDSEIRQGTAVRVYIPARIEEPTERKEKTEERLIGHDELVLVIDDEQAIRDVTKETLESSGYRVICAENGAEGVAEYAQHANDVSIVLTDMLMPVMDGVATIAALRKIMPDVKVIVTSGFAEDGKAEAAKQMANAFLARPFTATKLLSTIHEILLVDQYQKR